MALDNPTPYLGRLMLDDEVCQSMENVDVS